MREFPPKEHISPCSERLHKDGTDYCLAGSRFTGLQQVVSTKTCAQCFFIDGKPSQDLILTRSLTQLAEALDYLVLGFYSEEVIYAMLMDCYKTMQQAQSSDKPHASKMYEQFKQRLINAIELCYSRGLADYNELNEYVEKNMPDLIDPNKAVEEKSTCSSCDNKSFGVMGYLAAKFSGKVAPETANSRTEICKLCNASDRKGERLYREIDGKFYCGEPKRKKIYRSEKLDGCGCDLSDKVLYRKSKCPRDNWGFAE